jgi:hypothetical protein
MTVLRIGGSNQTGGSTGANQHAEDTFTVSLPDSRQAELSFRSCDAPRWCGDPLTDDERAEALEIAAPLCVYND